MRSLLTLLLACSAILFFSCDNSIDSSSDLSDNRATTLSIAPDKDTTILSSTPVIAADNGSATPVTLNASKRKSNSTERQLNSEIDDEIERQLALNPELPELMNIAEAYENTATVSMFTKLAESTSGQAYMIDNASFVVEAITEIIKNYMTGDADLVFLIDKTGSMENDIKEIDKSAEAIIDALSTFPDAHVGVAFYGDKNVDGKRWFTLTPLSTDYKSIKKTIHNISTTGGGDEPESVNDGIVRTINEMNWTPGKKRIILLLGDAPSLAPPYADNTLEDVIALSKESDVKMNFFPVVIGTTSSIKGVAKVASVTPKPADVISSVSPNPATNMALLKTGEVDDYTMEVFDINGQLLETKKFHDNNTPIYTDTYSTGVYVIRTTNTRLLTSETIKLVVKH